MSQILTQAKRKVYNERLRDVNLAKTGNNESVYLSKAYGFQRDYPTDGVANLHLTRAFFMAQRFEEAMHYGERAHKILPQNEDVNILLARIYLHFELYEFASPILKTALRLFPTSTFLHWAAAEYHMAAQNGQKARSHFEQALKFLKDEHFRILLQKDYVACLVSIGEKQAANEILSDLQNLPEQKQYVVVTRVSLGLADMTTETMRQIEVLLKNPEISEKQKSHLLLVLGNAHDRSQEYEQAFDLWEKARKLPNNEIEDQISGSAVLSVSFFTKELLDELKPYGHESTKPVFIVGMPRSGTTLAEQILSAHSKVAGVGEIGRMSVLNTQFIESNIPETTGQGLRLRAKEGELKVRGDEYLSLLKTLADEPKQFVIDKMPSQYVGLGYALMCFPHARVVHCQRHPADSFISSFQSMLKDSHAYTRSQKAYANAYRAKEMAMRHWKSIYPENIFDLQYENLVQNPQLVLKELIGFMGLEWEDSCLSFFNNKKPIQTLSQNQVNRPIYSSSVARWKHYRPFLDELFAGLETSQQEI